MTQIHGRHSYRCPSVSANVKQNRAAVAIPTPAQSSRCRRSRSTCGMNRYAATSTPMPIGRLMKKIHRQSRTVMRRPPSVGPRTVASPATAPQMPSAVPRRCGGNVAMMMAIVCGISAAAPRPWTRRAAISWPGVWATPQARLATVNSATPTMKTLRWPRRSPSRPKVISSRARTSTYPLTTHNTSSSEASSWSIMLGIAMLTIVRSSSVMRKPVDSVSKIAHGFPCHLRIASSASSVGPARRIRRIKEDRQNPGPGCRTTGEHVCHM